MDIFASATPDWSRSKVKVHPAVLGELEDTSATYRPVHLPPLKQYGSMDHELDWGNITSTSIFFY